MDVQNRGKFPKAPPVYRAEVVTPQLAAKLTIHEPDARGLASGTLVTLPTRRFPRRTGLIDGADRAQPSLLRREALTRRLLGVADVVAAGLALWFVLNVLGQDHPALLIVAGMPLMVLLFKIAGLYDRDRLRIVHSSLDEAPALAQLTGLYTLSVTILQPLVIEGRLGVGQIAALWLTTFAAIMGGRVIARWVAGHLFPPERCLVIGEPRLADRVRAKLASSGARALVVATLPLEGGDELEHLADPDSLRGIARDLGIHRVIVAPTTADAAGVVELIRIAKAAGVRVSVLPRLLEVVGSAVAFEDVDGMTVLGVPPFGLPRSSRVLKRIFDLLTTTVGLVIVAPVMAAIAIAIKVETRGPIFFRQVRVGRDGRHFHILKFRSMVAGADAQKDDLRGMNEVGDGMFKISDDPRVTRIGRLLRRTSLDELPQLINVMRGEMSLVGPRPLVTDEDTQVLGLDRSRLHLTPGMTGPWQILGSRVPMREMVGIDYLYVATWSLWQDIKLLLRTVSHVARSGNV
jgi:exopolysaccharide biosynthesis polyprenyl glycosylphosphotransferase